MSADYENEEFRLLSAPTQRWLNSGSLIDIDGYSVFVHEAGAGPTLVLIHGFPTSSFDWREMITELSDDFHCMAIDLR